MCIEWLRLEDIFMSWVFIRGSTVCMLQCTNSKSSLLMLPSCVPPCSFSLLSGRPLGQKWILAHSYSKPLTLFTLFSLTREILLLLLIKGTAKYWGKCGRLNFTMQNQQSHQHQNYRFFVLPFCQCVKLILLRSVIGC